MAAMTTRTRIGRNLRAARQARGLTQAALAELVSKSVETVSNLERGNLSPSLDTLVALADAVGVAPAALLAGVGADHGDGPLAGADASVLTDCEFCELAGQIDPESAAHLLALARALASGSRRRR